MAAQTREERLREKVRQIRFKRMHWERQIIQLERRMAMQRDHRQLLKDLEHAQKMLEKLNDEEQRILSQQQGETKAAPEAAEGVEPEVTAQPEPTTEAATEVTTEVTTKAATEAATEVGELGKEEEAAEPAEAVKLAEAGHNFSFQARQEQ